MEKVIINRNDGIVYERKKKEVNFDYNVTFRARKEQVTKLKDIAKEKGVEYSSIIRELIENYIKEYERN